MILESKSELCKWFITGLYVYLLYNYNIVEFYGILSMIYLNQIFTCHMMPGSLDCSFVIDPSVMSNGNLNVNCFQYRVRRQTLTTFNSLSNTICRRKNNVNKTWAYLQTT
jgi:hypothetical protein